MLIEIYLSVSIPWFLDWEEGTIYSKFCSYSIPPYVDREGVGSETWSRIGNLGDQKLESWDQKLAIFQCFYQFFHFFYRETDCFHKKSIFWSKCYFTSFHKILIFGYQKIDFGCLKWCRMIPLTKKNRFVFSMFL